MMERGICFCNLVVGGRMRGMRNERERVSSFLSFHFLWILIWGWIEMVESSGNFQTTKQKLFQFYVSQWHINLIRRSSPSTPPHREFSICRQLFRHDIIDGSFIISGSPASCFHLGGRDNVSPSKCTTTIYQRECLSRWSFEEESVTHPNHDWLFIGSSLVFSLFVHHFSYDGQLVIFHYCFLTFQLVWRFTQFSCFLYCSIFATRKVNVRCIQELRFL